jgi:hypothetical protein
VYIFDELAGAQLVGMTIFPIARVSYGGMGKESVNSMLSCRLLKLYVFP